ncbi:MAG: LPS export ABC transporter periplasmic protein LptC [Calditrichaeota bacterium]|nr:LPS export ABC transporter periplasmic protein LptC [Calditrichota bacterium]MCB9392025.1 LPS export ABC transporter periplasmic protein LptC [Calditrichota bacterium]
MKRVLQALLLFGVLGCSSTPPPPEQPAEEEYPEQELSRAKISFYTNDRLATLIDAGHVLQYEKQNLIILDSGVVADFFDEFGTQRTRIWADSGTASETTRNLNAFGNVVARSDSGEQLETDWLRYENATGMIFAEGKVKISTPTDTIYGTGFRADKNLKNWTVDHPTGRTLRDRPVRTLEEETRPDSVSADSL